MNIYDLNSDVTQAARTGELRCHHGADRYMCTVASDCYQVPTLPIPCKQSYHDCRLHPHHILWLGASRLSGEWYQPPPQSDPLREYDNILDRLHMQHWSVPPPCLVRNEPMGQLIHSLHLGFPLPLPYPQRHRRSGSN